MWPVHCIRPPGYVSLKFLWALRPMTVSSCWQRLIGGSCGPVSFQSGWNGLTDIDGAC